MAVATIKRYCTLRGRSSSRPMESSVPSTCPETPLLILGHSNAIPRRLPGQYTFISELACPIQRYRYEAIRVCHAHGLSLPLAYQWGRFVLSRCSLTVHPILGSGSRNGLSRWLGQRSRATLHAPNCAIAIFTASCASSGIRKVLLVSSNFSGRVPRIRSHPSTGLAPPRLNY
jgi:hypothetical protein